MVHRHLVSGAAALSAIALLVVGCAEGLVTDPQLLDGGGGDPPADQRFETIVDTERCSVGAPGAAVAVVADGKVSFAEGFGSTKYRGSKAVATTTIFPIGSLTKPLTAIGLLRLVDAGEVDLDSPISRYLPELISKLDGGGARPITIRDLLTQSSGLPDERVNVSFYDPGDSMLAEFFAGNLFAEKYHVMFEPGRMYYDSSLGFGLLGLVIERVTGRSFSDYMRDEVFSALDMSRATFRTAEVAADGDYAFGTLSGNVPIYPLVNAQPWQRPAALAYASVLDLAAFARFLINGDESVLSAALHAEMLSPQINTHLSLDRVHQGLGILVFDGYPSQAGLLDHEVTTVAYEGNLHGHTVQVAVLPESRFAFISAANRNDARFDRSATAALAEYLGLPEVPGDTPTVEVAAELANYAGTYHADSGKPTGSGQVNVTVKGDHLRLTCLSTAWTFDLMPANADNFECPSGYSFPLAALTFLRDSDGEIEYLRAMSLGFVARRE